MNDYNDLQVAINYWYGEWLLTHDPFEDDFDTLLNALFANYSITFDTHDKKYIITGKYNW